MLVRSTASNATLTPRMITYLGTPSVGDRALQVLYLLARCLKD
jgi:hypothetical protein